MDERDANEVADARELMRGFLAHRDVPCPMCGYNLRDLRGERCPECGEPLELKIGLTMPRMAGFLAGLIGLCFGAGFFVLLGAWISFMLISGRHGPDLGDILMVAFGTLILVPATLLWVRWRRWICQCSKPQRSALVFFTWLLTVTMAIAFFMIVD